MGQKRGLLECATVYIARLAFHLILGSWRFYLLARCAVSRLLSLLRASFLKVPLLLATSAFSVLVRFLVAAMSSI